MARKKDERDRREYLKEWYLKNKEKQLQQVKEKQRQLKKEVIGVYGGKCACCSETTLDFLAIDHINGDGNQHRKEIGAGGTTLHRWLKNNGYPEGFQVLCHNCNFSKHINGGTCIHKLS